MSNKEYEDTIVCPYCDHKFDQIWDYGLNEEGDVCEIECDCGESFTASVNISYSYDSTKILCEEKDETCEFELEDSPYGAYIYNMKNWTIWRCTKCDDEVIKTGPVKVGGPYIIEIGEGER